MNKRGLVWDELLPWIIFVLVLFIMLGAYFFISGKWNEAWEYFKNLWGFGR